MSSRQEQLSPPWLLSQRQQPYAKPLVRKLRFLLALVAILSVVLVARPFVSISPTRAQGPIQHIIFIVKENHSFDSYFGAFPGANGTLTGKIKVNGVVSTIPLNPLPNAPANYDHQWPAAHADYDMGKMDNFNNGEKGADQLPIHVTLKHNKRLYQTIGSMRRILC